MDWLLLDPPVDITDNGNGAPWWAVIVAAAVAVVGTLAATWATRRRDQASNEQTLIDQLQQEVRSLRSDMTSLQAEVRILRLREIAWITYTSDLTRAVLQAGGKAPEMPAELRGTPVAAVVPVTAD